MNLFCPVNTAEVAEIISETVAEQRPLEIIGGGTKRALGNVERPGNRLKTIGLTGVIDYDPAELVLTARAGTPMWEIEDLLEANRQMLAFEPPSWQSLLGSDGEATLGGVLACNLSGPRRVRSGAARDHLLGFSAVNGRGEIWRAGGKVVKNVTGYDMCKLLTGSYGTLSVLTEVSIRVLPRPETSASIIVPANTTGDAVRIMTEALNSEHEVSAAAFIPTNSSSAKKTGEVVIRIEGHAPSVEFRAAALRQLFARTDRLPEVASERLWCEIAAVEPMLGNEMDFIWKISCPASAASGLLHSIQDAIPDPRILLDWGGGLIWLAASRFQTDVVTATSAIRSAVDGVGGHVTLIRAPNDVRNLVAPFHPQSPALAALSERVKTAFDPHRVLNPGRMYEGV